jgi:hypothetical protein
MRTESELHKDRTRVTELSLKVVFWSLGQEFLQEELGSRSENNKAISKSCLLEVEPLPREPRV